MKPKEQSELIHEHLVDTLGLLFFPHASYSFRHAYGVKQGVCLSVWFGTKKITVQVYDVNDKVVEVDLPVLEDPRPALTKLVIQAMFQ